MSGYPEEYIEGLLRQAWLAAEAAYGTGANAERFMENPQPASLGVENDEKRRMLSPVALIERDGQKGFNKVMTYLNNRQALKVA